MDRARQNAEDLFKPRQHTTPADAATSAPDAIPSEQQPRRQPRVLAILAQKPASATTVEARTDRDQVQAAIKPQMSKMPTSQYGRVRALTSYWMTCEQVAELLELPLKKSRGSSAVEV